MIRPFNLIVWLYPGIVLKRAFVLKLIYCLVKHGLDFIIQCFSSAEHNRFECGLDWHVHHNKRYDLPYTVTAFILYIHAVGIGQPLSK